MNIGQYQELQLAKELTPQMGGVFSLFDLRQIFRTGNKVTFFNLLAKAETLGVITRFSRGIYVTKDYSPEMLSARIDPDAYISMGTVLAKNGLVGTSPERLITAIKVGKRRTYSGASLQVCHLGISKDLYFGFTTLNGIKYADNEKAYIDVLYYRMRGERYVFDELSDIDITRLDKDRCRRYLTRYKNKRFVKFCLETLDG